MSEDNKQLEGGAYEVIRARLEKQSVELRSRLDALNVERKEIFGAVESSLVSTERVTTEHNCVPRDLIAIGKNRFLFGYNIQFGLKQTTDLADVFAVYQYDPSDHSFTKLSIDEVIDDSEFATDFAYLYKYYKQTIFAKFMHIGPNVYIALRVGKDITDVKTFKFVINGDGSLKYMGNRFDYEYVFPDQHGFSWVRVNRDMHRGGEHPHISIEDKVFVETVGGDLTVKIEDNTADGKGIYAEEVVDQDQTLDDAEISYAIVGPLIILKILPYREKNYRYLVFNEKNQSVDRIDAIGESCVLLPEDHGIIFANGYYLLSGELKTFDHGLEHMRFERKISSANGEDTLFAFYNRTSGDYALLNYNLIEQTVETPVVCNGYSVFDNGELIYFKTEDEAQKHHTLQVWQTPILSADAVASQELDKGSYLYKIGNAELVSAMAESKELLTLLDKEDNYAGLYIDLVKQATVLLDSYFWISNEATKNLAEPLEGIQQAANSAIEEFEKVQRLRKNSAERIKDVAARCERLLRDAEHSPPDDIVGFVKQLAGLRTIRGEVIGLREMRYMDLARVEELEQGIIAATEIVSGKTVSFLLLPEALDPYRARVGEQRKILASLTKVTEADDLGEEISDAGKELEMLIDVVSNLKIEDSTQTTAIIESISAIYSTLNGVKAELKNKRKELSRSEGVAQFGAQMNLLSQAVVNYLDLCDTAEKTDGYLTKVMVQIEELEGRFAEFDEYVEELTTKREEVYNAFDGRKQQLLEVKSKRANRLIKSAERILSGISNRASGFKEINEINGYFAGDLMIEKVRDIIDELIDLGDSVKGDDIQTRLKTVREDAVRALKDRNELYVDGKDVIQFGKNKFNVNTQELELTVLPQDGVMNFHLSGTDFFEEICDPEFLATKDVWNQEVISENKAVYRAEYLVKQLLDSDRGRELAKQPESWVADLLLQTVQEFMQPRYAESYTKGVHDNDAARLLAAILPIHTGIGLLRFDARDRALAMLFWIAWEGENKELLAGKIRAHAKRREIFGINQDEQHALVNELVGQLNTWSGVTLVAEARAEDAAAYLFEELSNGEAFVVSPEAAELVKKFKHSLTVKHAEKSYEETLLADAVANYQINQDWLAGFLSNSQEQDDAGTVVAKSVVAEAAAHLTRGGFDQRDVKNVRVSAEVSGMIGDHKVISNGAYQLDYNQFSERLSLFEREVAPTFASYQKLKQELVEEKRQTMRLDEFKPKVMSSFVRNKLLNNVFLPLVGDNLAKQIGTAGKDTRTDRMGLLLLISPPGYGKTTLMEYVANRLGLTFMKINGPALGHNVVSLDPSEAPNATAAEEVKKLNLALEMGDNVMIYLDDIQHTHSEFLQKFISLCDGQRKIEGVYKGVARTYDLRGKKVAVVMAGNPYTETGGKFQIPDMLANRADTYNLGDIIGGHAEDFKGSYIENSLTSNTILSKLSSRSQKDVYAVMQIARTDSQEGVDFEGNYTPEEIGEMVRVTKHLYRVRDSILRVNLEYIRSAAQEDAYRTEPAFKLQGSYRNMNRIAEKVLPLMTEKEVEGLVVDHYENESQTLTKGAESNILKFREMENLLTEEETERWDDIKKGFSKNLLLGAAGGDNDPVARIVAQLTQFNDGLDSIKDGIVQASTHYAEPQSLGETTISHLEKIIAGLRAVPVEVDIKIVPVEDVDGDGQNDGKISGIEKSKKSPIDIQPEVRQGE
ncbi:DNA repair ATPase [Rubritalea profundi]|uniref:AAA family ATPase n=1 Tax=Rubritalea profundi TaxID=1658618 RepID=A0A2S7U1X8_9BACT|nr:DNA repair ATPase [Rubritalea profundi]PQJ28610.1 AAA family ATPase [Rubritalea profundi]